MGAIGGIMSLAGLTWYANPALWAAWSQINNKPKRAVIFSLVGTILATSFLLATEISDVKPNITSYITGYQTGYWLWLASMATMLVGSLINYLVTKNHHATNQRLALLQVDFNNRYSGGIKLKTHKDVYRHNKTKIRLQYGIHAILWDVDYDDKKRDDLAVEAFIYYNRTEKSWVARFDFNDLLHESQREKPLLDN
ncbi:hypothetical protein GCM10022392_11190 [Mucilaginibacter panaciglaebae]|uniref:Uncharacterized protein n=2 Tax=Mucilaginibacter panaciglaebae TaxID=502331 RepID=A0ABP7WL59_9SPHI